MSIKYTVVENPLHPDQFYPLPVVQDTRDLDSLLRKMSQKSTLSPADARAVIEAFIDEILDGLVDGDRVSIDRLCEFRPRLSQKLTSAADAFDPAQGGEFYVSAIVKPSVTEKIRSQVRFSKVVRAKKIPVILSIFDGTTQMLRQYTPGKILTVAGQGLKISDASAGSDEGVYFVSHLDGTETKVPAIASNGDRKLMFDVPEGLTGTQDLHVRTRYTPGGGLRTGIFERVFQA